MDINGYCESTICALATPNGAGGIAVIRLSGKEAFNILSTLVNRDIFGRKSHTLFLSEISDDEGVIDQVVISIFRSPNSYTGEDVAEISCHASQYIISRILSAMIDKGAKMASGGEFTMRAFLNGRMDLLQAEAVADLIASENKASHLIAINQLKGGVSAKMKLFRDKLMELSALVELELDFSEEDVEFADRDELKSILAELRFEATTLRSSFNEGNAIKEGVPIAIIGRPNAGKSTLLNVLLNEDRAIVSDIPGTTRDAIEDVAIINGVKFRFIDTAGLRETKDEIEMAGIQRTYEKMRKAKVWLYIFDISNFDSLNDAYEYACTDVDSLKYSVINTDIFSAPKVIYIGNKCDDENFDYEVGSPYFKHIDMGASYPNMLTISAKYNKGIDFLKERLLSVSGLGNITGKNEIILSNARHFEILGLVLDDINAIEAAMDNGLSSDLIAIDIRRALKHLGEITGEIVADDILGLIFGRFCIGK